jgi:hypothetical protein
VDHHADGVLGTVTANVADQIAGLVDPDVVYRRFQLAVTDVADVILLANRPAGPEQFLK